MPLEKTFTLTVDTEPDNEWARPNLKEMTFHNAEKLPLFHKLCRKYDIKPVYLVDYQMCRNSILQKHLRAYLERGECEIGAHLHPWSTPPFEATVTKDDFAYHPFIPEYSIEIFERKLDQLLHEIHDKFSVQATSFRAGRYALSADYALVLKRRGIVIDCSVTPYRHWEPKRNAPGSDFTQFTPAPFFWDEENELLGFPLSAISLSPSHNIFNPYVHQFFKNNRIVRKTERIFPTKPLLYLKGVNWFFRYKKYTDLLVLLKLYCESNPNFVQAMLHSSELIEGGCFRTNKEVRDYLLIMEQSFRFLQDKGYRSVTLSEFYQRYMENDS